MPDDDYLSCAIIRRQKVASCSIVAVVESGWLCQSFFFGMEQVLDDEDGVAVVLVYEI